MWKEAENGPAGQQKKSAKRSEVLEEVAVLLKKRKAVHGRADPSLQKKKEEVAGKAARVEERRFRAVREHEEALAKSKDKSPKSSKKKGKKKAAGKDETANASLEWAQKLQMVTNGEKVDKILEAVAALPDKWAEYETKIQNFKDHFQPKE